MLHGETTSELIAGRYRLVQRLARGSSGEVFVACDESTGKQLALKRLLPEALGRASAANFMREFHALSTLKHPRIIEVDCYGVDGAAPFYTMELLDGNDLSELSPLPYREACAYLRDVALSLALLHDRRLLHRDVSPRNVRLTGDGRCKLIDFGAMVPFGRPSNTIGTPPCLAPEAVQGGALDQRADLYSLGAVAYYVLTGRHAFPARQLSALPGLWRHGAPSPRERGCDIPQALDELVMSLLRPDPVQRPSSAAEVIERLSAIGELEQVDDLAIGRSCLASTPLLGRMRERAQLLESLRNTKEGRGSAFWFTGDVGSGKTRMLTEASLIGQTCGLAVIRVTLSERRAFSSSLARDLVAGLMQVAPEEAERASEQHPLLKPLIYGAELADDRAELSRQVDGFVCDIASRVPLLLTFDDVHHGTDRDVALIAALAHRTKMHSLCVVATARSSKDAVRLATVSELATRIHLKTLDRRDVSMLAGDLFGNVPNLECVSEFFYRTAQGNPKLTLELAQHLLTRGVLSYAGGSWVLPDRIDEAMPRDIAQTLMLRLESIDADARELVELMCVRRRGVSIEQLLELAAPLSNERIFRALDELVRVGVLESAGSEYAFVQEALRAELCRTLSQDRSRALHRRWADYLLELEPTDEVQLEAGWHLVNTPDELRGAKLLAQVAPELVERRVNMAAAVPALERALDVYERHGQSLNTRLRLRALLVMSSYLYDHRLADRYASDTLDLLYPYTGLHEAERCARWIGRRAGFFAGLIWAGLRWLLRAPAQRGPHVVAALKFYAQSTMGWIGMRALLYQDTQPALERMRGFEGAPVRPLALTYETARAVHLNAIGHSADARHAVEHASAMLEKKIPWQVTTQEQRDLRIGLLLLRGMNEALRERSGALECAAKLERIGTPLANAASARIRMTYYLVRGDTATAQYHRRLLELQSVESGSLWQVQWVSIPVEAMAAATWHDLVGMRRALERLDQIVAEAPVMSQMYLALRLPYHFHRGDYELAASLGEEYMRKYPPMTRVGWSPNFAIAAFAYAHLGRPERALEICENALAKVSDEEHEYLVLYAPLNAAYATALALTGQVARSREVFRACVERLRAAGEHLRAVVIHAYRLRAARLACDREEIQAALEDMRQTAAESGNPAAVDLAHRLSEDRRVHENPPAQEDEDLRYAIDTIS